MKVGEGSRHRRGARRADPARARTSPSAPIPGLEQHDRIRRRRWGTHPGARRAGRRPPTPRLRARAGLHDEELQSLQVFAANVGRASAKPSQPSDAPAISASGALSPRSTPPSSRRPAPQPTSVWSDDPVHRTSARRREAPPRVSTTMTPNSFRTSQSREPGPAVRDPLERQRDVGVWRWGPSTLSVPSVDEKPANAFDAHDSRSTPMLSGPTSVETSRVQTGSGRPGRISRSRNRTRALDQLVADLEFHCVGT